VIKYAYGEMVRLMECIYEKEISTETNEQVYLIAKDYASDYFTSGFPDDMKIDMRFQSALLLVNGSEIVSCIIYTCLDGSLHITMMATKRKYSGKGYGKQLMNFFIDHARGFSLKSVELYTFSPKSKPLYKTTVKFYEGCGFKIIAEHMDLWEMGVITVKMRNDL
jgi:GNAT superfamily N-acetyltransferase